MGKITSRSTMPVNTISNTDIFLISKDNGDGTFTSYKVTGSQMKSNFKGLSNFTEGVNTSSPNNTVNVTSLSANTSSTNGDFVITPKGTGALLVDIPDNTAIGGNKRGANAVDLQSLRTGASQVASGTGAVILGGSGCVASGTYSIAGGDRGGATGFASVGLQEGVASGSKSFAFGVRTYAQGDNSVAMSSDVYTDCIASGVNSFASGPNNKASGMRSLALGGESNTASGSRSVSLGSSNISSGSYSYSMGYGNTTAGYNGVVALGWSNTITAGASYGAFAVGQQNGVSGQGFAIGVQNSVSNGCALGTTNTATNGVALGTSNTVDAGGSTAIGKQASVFGIKGRVAYSAGQVSALGDSQASKFILQRRTTDATATTLISDAVSSPTPYLSNQVILPNNSAYGFTGTIIAKQAGSTNAALWKVEGLLVRGASAGATVLLSPTITLVSNVPNWGTPTLAADTSNGGLKVDVIGAAATNIQWTAVIETTEVIYA